MRKTVRLKNLADAAGRNIRSLGKYEPYEKYSDRNDAIMRRLLDELIRGDIDYINHVDDVYFKCIHRSTRDGIAVQMSVGYYNKKGELIPCSHANINNFKDLRDEGYPSGIWEAVKIA